MSKKKPKSFTMTLTEEEYARLMVLAVADGRTMASYLRHQVNERYRARSKRRVKEKE